MASLVTLQGPDTGRKYSLDADCAVLGRQIDCNICLPAKTVSRQHAQVLREGEAFYVEDLGSNNGTFLNGKRIAARERIPLGERDMLQIGPYVLALEQAPAPAATETSLRIREQLSAASISSSIYTQAPAQKLQVVLEISQHLSRTLEVVPLLEKLLDQLMRLFPHADRCMVMLLEEERLVVRAQRCRYKQDETAYPYSRTVVRRALDDGVGLLSEDVQTDLRFDSSATLSSLNLHSLLCVPLITQDGRRLGVIQADRFRPGGPFRGDDLQLLTTIALQVAVVLDNAALHVELLREERLRQELALAREIQQGFMPTDFDDFDGEGFQLYATVQPARVVSGDLYDFSRVPDGRLAFFVGDVSGKGMPAALFMVAVRTLGRHLCSAGGSPADTLTKLNDALAADNPSGMFVTLAHGLYTPATGEVVMASGGHHLPLLRHGDGRVEEVAASSGRLLGYDGFDLHLSDTHFTLGMGDLLFFYTDGITEAREAVSKKMFAVERLSEAVTKFDRALDLQSCAELLLSTVERFTGGGEPSDDRTLFLLRRGSPPRPDLEKTCSLRE